MFRKVWFCWIMCHKEQLKIYGGTSLATFFNVGFMSEVAVFLQIILTAVTIWYTIRKGRKK
ncbi:hypothetical protein [Flagellimonas sp. CMM7]|uniref:hypothetical protein n=1 Tax=Flagellimonas sp. CMM7 TaxID=2654676 RepID=UPI0013D85F8D|nr:hypothetical protein [Flagellimonas sp. CMM7]UII79570.1 hypothetical protein LV704_18155 [Flagellimonas sp. CMM7]